MIELYDMMSFDKLLLQLAQCMKLICMYVSRYRGDVCDLLERGLTSESASHIANALKFIARELTAGRLDSNSVDSSLQSLQPGVTLF